MSLVTCEGAEMMLRMMLDMKSSNLQADMDMLIQQAKGETTNQKSSATLAQHERRMHTCATRVSSLFVDN